jgi:predicted nucleic-acid-binding Zn-ribbon protein
MATNKSSKCPKCMSGEMIEHPSRAADKSKAAIEDQDADFVFKFISCRNCGYSEFYLVGGGVRKKRV